MIPSLASPHGPGPVQAEREEPLLGGSLGKKLSGDEAGLYRCLYSPMWL